MIRKQRRRRGRKNNVSFTTSHQWSSSKVFISKHEVTLLHFGVMPLCARRGARGFSVCVPGFLCFFDSCFCVAPVLSLFPYPLGMGMFTQFRCILEVCNLFFFFFLTEDHSWVCLSLRGIFGLELLSNDDTVKTLRPLRDRLNAFCIMKWTWTFGGQGNIVRIWLLNVA